MIFNLFFRYVEKLKKYTCYYGRDFWGWVREVPVIHCLGDSHVTMFKYFALNDSSHDMRFRWCIVRGATASGVPNPRSVTQAGRIYDAYVRKVPANHYILTCLGEVDCGFIIWYRSKKYREPIELQFQRSLNNYFDFLRSIESTGHTKIIVCSVPLPTILDNQVWGAVANLRKDVDATLRERTDITLRYNCHLREFCRETGKPFFDFESYTLNQDTRLVDSRFRNANPLNHHLSNDEIAKIMPLELERLGFINKGANEF